MPKVKKTEKKGDGKSKGPSKYFILQSASTWYVATSMSKVTKLYNSLIPDERYKIHAQHLYALKLKQRKRGLYKGLALEISDSFPKPPKGFLLKELKRDEISDTKGILKQGDETSDRFPKAPKKKKGDLLNFIKK